MCCSCLPTSTTANGNILTTPRQLPLQDSPSDYCSGRLQRRRVNSQLIPTAEDDVLQRVFSTCESAHHRLRFFIRSHLLTGTTTNVFIDVVDTCYSDHDATYISVPATPPMDSSMLSTSSVFPSTPLPPPE